MASRVWVFSVSPNGPELHSLRLSITNANEAWTETIIRAVRRMFDLDADPVLIGEALERDPFLADRWATHPGLRIPRSWDRFETIVTTILGQLVSVSFGRTLIRELMQTTGTERKHPRTGESIFLFPTPEQLLRHDLSAVRTSESRRATIRSAAEMVTNKTLRLDGHLEPKQLRKVLLSVRGIGAWSAEYIAMRAFDDDDAFPATDYGLKQQVRLHPEMNINRARPLRAYAAAALWKSFLESKGRVRESVL